MIRAFEDGTMEFAAMPYDPEPLVVSFRKKQKML